MPPRVGNSFLSQGYSLSNWGQLVATMESLMPSGLKPKRTGRALESLFPVGWSSKVGVPSNSSAEIGVITQALEERLLGVSIHQQDPAL